MNNFLKFGLLFLFSFCFSQKGLTGDYINYGSKLNHKDFHLIFNDKKSKLSISQKLQLDKIIQDFNEITLEGNYSSIWIMMPIIKDDIKYERIQLKRSINILKYLMNNGVETKLISVFRNLNKYSNEKSNIIDIYYD